MNESSNKHVVLGIVAATIVLFGGLVWLVSQSSSNQKGQEEQVTFDDTNDPFVGLKDSKVVVHVYGDYQCPACRAYEPALTSAITKFADRVKFVFKDFPLETIHKNARLSANAVRCAQDQQRFVQYRDVLYQTQPDWGELPDPTSKLIEYAKQVGVNESTFTSCLSNKADNVKVSADVSEGLSNNVDSTPTFFVNHVRYQGLQEADWDKILTEALQK